MANLGSGLTIFLHTRFGLWYFHHVVVA